MKKQALSVKPVRRYSRPKYPSWQAPNPLDHPGSIPYPLRKRAQMALLASGLASSLSLGSTACGEEKSATPFTFAQDSLYNPFTADRIGLPYHPPFFGTGEPERLRDKEVRAVFEKVFSAGGLQLRPDFRLNTGKLSVRLDGYDPERRTGYLFIGYNRLDTDGVESEFNHYRGGCETESCNFNREVRLLLENEASSPYFTPSKLFREKLKAVRQQSDSTIRENLLRKAANEELLRGIQPNLKNKWLLRQIRSALRLKNAAAREKAVERCVSIYDILGCEYLRWSGKEELLVPALDRWAQQLDSAGRFPISESDTHLVLRTIMYYKHLGEQLFPPQKRTEAEKQAIQDKKNAVVAAFSADGPSIGPALRSLATEVDDFIISIPETREIENLATDSGIYIALLSQFDPRWGYYRDDEQGHSDIQKEMAAAETRKDTVGLHKLQQIEQQYKTSRLREMEQEAYRFMEWARREGRY